MKKIFNDIKETKQQYSLKDKEFWKRLDYKSIGLYYALPIFTALSIGSLMGFFIGYSIKPNNNTPTASIVSTVDLPEQISQLQNTELTVLENTLSLIDSDELKTTDENPNPIGKIISSINYNTELNDFFKMYLSLDYKTTAEAQFFVLKDYFSEKIRMEDSDEASQLKQNVLDFFEGNSFPKSSQSKTSLASSVIPSIVAGSTSENVIYNVIVPVTNEDREWFNLSFIVKMDKNKKITAITYQGKISDNGNIEDWYKGLNSILTDNPIETTNFDSFTQNTNTTNEKEKNSDGEENDKTSESKKK